MTAQAGQTPHLFGLSLPKRRTARGRGAARFGTPRSKCAQHYKNNSYQRLLNKRQSPKTLKTQSPASNRRPYCTRLACFNAFIITFAAGDNSLSDRVMIPKASIWHGISSGSTVTIPCAA